METCWFVTCTTVGLTCCATFFIAVANESLAAMPPTLEGAPLVTAVGLAAAGTPSEVQDARSRSMAMSERPRARMRTAPIRAGRVLCQLPDRAGPDYRVGASTPR